MDHPNIARVLDAGATESGRPYFVMELVEGLPITTYCDQNRLTIAERLDLFVLVCRAVQHAHQKGVIHRDLKPSNVLVTVQDDAPVPKVIDFGIAKALTGQLAEQAVTTGLAQIVGTPLYMSPEQAGLNGHDVDTRSDIYSLGVLLYELLTGTTPFEPDRLKRAALDEVCRIIREQEPSRPSTRLSTLTDADRSSVTANRQTDPRKLSHALHGELDWIVLKCLEKDRQRRYESASALAGDLMRYLTDRPVEARPPSVGYRLRKLARRHQVVLAAAILVLASMIAGTVVSMWQAIEARKARRATAAVLVVAQRQRETARRAVDEMYTQVAEKWLSNEGALTSVQKDFLEKALAFYEEFARERVDDPEARAEVAQAQARVGDIQDQLGQSAQALESQRRALESFRRLSAKFPDRADYQRWVARCLNSIGRLQLRLGRTRDAETTLREAVDVGERLAKAPGAPDDRADLAVSLGNLGVLLVDTGRRDDGKRAEDRSADLLDRLVTEFPREPRYQSQLATTENSLGGSSSGAECEARYRRSLELRHKLADADPTDAEQRIGLAMAYHNLGCFFRGSYRYAQAVNEFRRALPFEEKLVADYPDRPRYRAILAQTLGVLADQLSRLNQMDEAEQVMRRSQKVAERLAADFPDVLDNRRRVAVGATDLGAILVERGRNREAGEAFELAYSILKKLTAAHHDLSTYRHTFAAICYKQAVNYDTMTGREAQDVARARELAREAVAIEPEEPGFWKGLALAEYRAGDLDAALKAETKALEMRHNAGYEYDWVLLALIHFARGDRDLARAWFGSAYLAKRAGGSWGGEEDLRRLGAESESVLAELIPRHPEDVRDVWTVLLKDFRQRLGPTHPKTLRVMDRLADQLAALGRETQARALFDESRRAQPDRYTTEWPTFGPWFPLAVLTIRHGDVDGYGALCAEMLQRFEGTKEPVVAEQVARMCTLIPGVVDNPRRALELGRKAVAADANQPFFLLARGSAEYRAGQFQAAVETLGESARKNGQPWGRAQAELFLAMAHARLGHAEQARRTLAEAERSLAKLPEKPDVFTLQLAWHWRERAIFQVLLREAATVLGLAPDTMPDGPAAFGP